MPRVEKMFGDIVDPSVKVGTKQWYTIPLSIAVHTFTDRSRMLPKRTTEYRPMC